MKEFLNKFKHAFDGLWHGLRNDKSIQLQVLLAVSASIVFIVFFDLEKYQGLFVIIVMALVIAFEFINSAIERTVDMITDTYDERAKHIKDYAAAAVLIICILAVIIAAFVLL